MFTDSAAQNYNIPLAWDGRRKFVFRVIPLRIPLGYRLTIGWEVWVAFKESWVYCIIKWLQTLWKQYYLFNVVVINIWLVCSLFNFEGYYHLFFLSCYLIDRSSVFVLLPGLPCCSVVYAQYSDK